MNFARTSALAGFAAVTLAAGAAEAGGSCVGECYERVSSPPVYEKVVEQVMVAPPRQIAHRIPAEFAAVARPVTIAPEQTVARHVPAEYQTVSEKVMVSPGGRRWVVRRDSLGREIGCWEYTPAQYATRYRTVITRPPGVIYQRVPAVTALTTQHVMVRPPSVSYETIPAEYATRHRTVMVSPGSQSWQPVGSGYGRPYRY